MTNAIDTALLTHLANKVSRNHSIHVTITTWEASHYILKWIEQNGYDINDAYEYDLTKYVSSAMYDWDFYPLTSCSHHSFESTDNTDMDLRFDYERLLDDIKRRGGKKDDLDEAQLKAYSRIFSAIEC